MQTMRFDADQTARQEGIRDALILVRESWGSEVMVRMWAVGVPRGEAEQFYRRVDTCLLHLKLLDVEALGLQGPDAQALILPLLVDSANVRRSGLSPDRTQMALPGATYPPHCIERIRQDSLGFTLFAPLLLAGQDGNQYVRDLPGRNTRLVRTLNARQWYRLRPPGPEEGLQPEFERLDGTSLGSPPVP